MSDSSVYRILTIDDEDAIRRSIRSYLEDSDFEVIEARNGREGLELFASEHPDLILCDLRMPEVDGLEVLAAVTRESPETPILIVSGTGILGDAIEAVRLGAWDYILKPISDLGVLEHAINKALERARLRRENRLYQEHLEDEVLRRTLVLEERTRELARANAALEEDIGERRRIEAALTENQRYLQVLFENLGVGMMIVDAETLQITDINPAALSMMGRERDSIINVCRHKCVCPAEVGACPVKDLGRIVDNTERELIRADGSRLPILKTVAPITLDGRKLYLETFVDISERKRTEEALAESETRFRTVVDWLTEGLIIGSVDDVIIYANSRIANMLGYTVQEMVGMERAVMGADHVRAMLRENTRKRLAGQSNTYETEFQCKSGEALWVEVSSGPYKSPAGAIVGTVTIVRDISERKRAEQEREKLESQLRRSQKLETIGTLAGGVAHDFNNILTPILGYGEMAKIHLDRKSPARADLEQIIQAAHRARELVRQILTFSRQGDQERKPMLIQFIIKEALKLIRASIPSTIEIREDVDTSCNPVLCEPTQVHQVLMNLCTNAFQAMRSQSDGVLRVELKMVEASAPLPCVHGYLPDGRYARLTVSDTGCGMSRATLDRMFEPFFTTKPAGEGTGLGLSVVHGIVTAHGGGVSVQSEEGAGTHFQIYLPVTDSGIVDDQSEDVLPAYGNERVLFVDDERTNAQLAKQMLAELGYEVTAMTDSRAALECFQSDPEAFDLVITDQTMPQMTGAELAQEILRLRPGMPIMLVTGFSEVVTSHNYRQAGFRGYLMKPIILRDLAALIRDILDEVPAVEPD